MGRRVALTAAILLTVATHVYGQAEDVADVASQDLRAGADQNKHYFLIGPKAGAAEPKEGYRLVVVMPGGGGTADFLPFVKRIFKNALTERYLVAELVAVKWTPGQQVVWPTATTPAEKQQFSTEDFIRAVIDDVRTRHRLDDRFIFTLSWSSSGPAAYAISLQDRTPVTGSFVAMSVFKPDQLASLERAKGHPYFLYHSPEDRVCPFRMAEAARDALTKQGATVQLATYAGGHGWRGNVFADIRRGIEWLERSVPAQAKPGQTTESR